MAIEIREHVSLAERTTLGLGGHALAEAVVRDEAGLAELGEALARLGGEPLALGAGSNILAADGELGVVLVSSLFATGPEIVAGEDAGAVVRVGAGRKLQKFLAWLASEGLGGLERLRGIPGNVGGACAMNAGSWGQSFCERLQRVRVWTPHGGDAWLGDRQFSYGYRSFTPQVEGFFLILEVELAMERVEPATLRSTMRETFLKKKSVQPLSARTAGCVFKNPEGESAGRLIDRAELRGVGLGDMAFSERHANFLVNMGTGRYGHARELIELAREAVAARFGVELELEVQVVR